MLHGASAVQKTLALYAVPGITGALMFLTVAVIRCWKSIQCQCRRGLLSQSGHAPTTRAGLGTPSSTVTPQEDMDGPVDDSAWDSAGGVVDDNCKCSPGGRSADNSCDIDSFVARDFNTSLSGSESSVHLPGSEAHPDRQAFAKGAPPTRSPCHRELEASGKTEPEFEGGPGVLAAVMGVDAQAGVASHLPVGVARALYPIFRPRAVPEPSLADDHLDDRDHGACSPEPEGVEPVTPAVICGLLLLLPVEPFESLRQLHREPVGDAVREARGTGSSRQHQTGSSCSHHSTSPSESSPSPHAAVASTPRRRTMPVGNDSPANGPRRRTRMERAGRRARQYFIPAKVNARRGSKVVPQPDTESVEPDVDPSPHTGASPGPAPSDSGTSSSSLPVDGSPPQPEPSRWLSGRASVGEARPHRGSVVHAASVRALVYAAATRLGLFAYSSLVHTTLKLLRYYLCHARVNWSVWFMFVRRWVGSFKVAIFASSSL